MPDLDGIKFSQIHPPPPIPGKPEPTSRLGNASILLAIITIVCMMASFLLARIDDAKGVPWQIRYTMAEYENILAPVSNLLFCGSPFLSVAGIILGLASIWKKDSNKRGVVGIILNILAIGIPLCLIILYRLP